MPNRESELALDEILKNTNITWGEERARNLGATVEALMQRRGFRAEELDAFNNVQDDFELVA